MFGLCGSSSFISVLTLHHQLTLQRHGNKMTWASIPPHLITFQNYSKPRNYFYVYAWRNGVILIWYLLTCLYNDAPLCVRFSSTMDWRIIRICLSFCWNVPYFRCTGNNSKFLNKSNVERWRTRIGAKEIGKVISLYYWNVRISANGATKPRH